MGAVLRDARPEDTSAVVDVVFACLVEFGLEPDPASTDKDIMLDPAKSHIWFQVLEDEASGAVIGCVGLLDAGDGVCTLRKMYLAAAHRRRGYGKMMLDRALAEARMRSFRRCNLETASALVGAKALYASYGFRPFCDPHLPERCDEAYFLEL